MKKLILILLLVEVTFNAYSQREKDNTLELAKQYFQNNEYEKAVVLYKDIFSKQSQNKIIYENYITCLIQLKQYEEAEKIIKKQIKRYGYIPSLRVDLGHVYAIKGEKEKARKEYEEAIDKLKPVEPDITDLARTFIRINETDFALRTYEQVRKLVNDETAYTNEITRIYSLKNNTNGIIEEQLNILRKNEFLLQEVQNNLQNYLTDKKDWDALKNNLLKRLQKYPDDISYAELLIWTLIQQKSFDLGLIQIIALNKRLNEQGDRIIDFANLCLSNKAYDVAIKAYKNIIDQGRSHPYYQQAYLKLLNTKNEKICTDVYTNEDLIILESEYQSFINEFGKNTKNAIAIYELANLKAFYLNKTRESIQLLEEIISKNLGSNSFIGKCKITLGDIYLLSGEVWEAALLYGQVDKAFRDEPLGQMAKFKNAKLSYYTGEFDWAKAQLDILKASTSQLISNDALNLSLLIADNTGLDSNVNALRMYAKADLLAYQNKFSAAIALLDSINLIYPGHALSDEILWVKANIFLKKNELSSCLDVLKTIYEQYGNDIWSDDALFLAAQIHEEKLQSVQDAMKLYERIINDYPGSLYVVEARKRFRALRGDNTIN